MDYRLSPGKLQLYQSCPRAYYCRYELGMKSPTRFGSAALGTALHKALAQIYGNWHYQEPLPPLEWIHRCWQDEASELSEAQTEEGKEILENYYRQFIANEKVMTRPVGIEGYIQGYLRTGGVELKLAGRYDRLDAVEDGLELIDYKSVRRIQQPESGKLDLQLGVYYLALEQQYQQPLKRLSLLYLRLGEKVCFEASIEHKEQVEEQVTELALQMRTDEQWEPEPGAHCTRCAYARYCPAVQEEPEPLPECDRAPLQLALEF